MANEIDAERIADKISLAAIKTDKALNNTYNQMSVLLTVFENIVSSVDDFQSRVIVFPCSTGCSELLL